MRLTLVLCCSLLLLAGVSCKKKRPHIMVIVGDDHGWNDVSWGNNSMHTPYMDAMRQESLELMRCYSQPKCTATRAALMTGRYPFHMGLQTKDVFSRHKNNTLDPRYKLLPAYFKDLNYSTYMIGKWHLGHCKPEATPIYNGFDTHFGSWGNTDNHFTMMSGKYVDWNLDNEPYWPPKDTYSAHLITNYTQYLLRNHFTNESTKGKPAFFYMAHLVPHKPAMSPDKYMNETNCQHIPANETYLKRRKFCGMVAAMDESIGNVTNTMRELGVLDDFIILYTSDNGGAIDAGANNYPLRGNKQTSYEGGTRVRTLLRAPKFLNENHTTGQYYGRIHITDWMPTLIKAAKGDPKSMLPEDIDGRNVWNKLKKGDENTRKWMVYNIDSERQLAVIGFKNETYDLKLFFSNDSSGREPGYRYMDPVTLVGQLSDKRKSSYRRDGLDYILYDLKDNEEELPPNVHPHAADKYPDMFDKMKRKLGKVLEEEVPVIKYFPVEKHEKNGAWRVAGC